MSCDCAKKADEKLAEHNTAIDWAWLIAPTGRTEHRLQIKTRKVNTKSRKPATILVATFCPFCGEKYERS